MHSINLPIDRSPCCYNPDVLPTCCTVSTESIEYEQFLVPYAIICIIIYPVGVNALYAVMLWKNRSAIRMEKDSTVDAKAKQETIADGSMDISFLHTSYSQDYFWWEAVDSV